MEEDRKCVGTSAFCWCLERRDGAGTALTSHDRMLLRGGVSYRPNPGVLPAAISRNIGLEPQAGEVAGALSAAALTEEDLALGRWDGARVRLTAVDWEDDTVEPVRLVGGELGEVSLQGGSFSADLRGAAWRLNEPVCPTTSPECRASFGDRNCSVDLAGRTKRATIISVDGTMLQLNAAVDERFLFGRLRHLSGANCGAVTVILAVETTAVRVRDAPRGVIEPGSVVELREGCDKRFATCVERFDNAENFRGEPHLPGNDLLTRYPGA